MKKSLLSVGLILMLAGGPGLMASPDAASAKAAGITGKVIETMNVATYTYVLVDSGGKQVWAAAPQFAVKAGDAVDVAEAMPMSNYHSKTLNRTFDVIYFSGSVTVNGARPGPTAAAAPLPAGHPPTTPATTLPMGHPTTSPAAAPAAPELSGIKRAANGQTVTEIVSGKAKLAGKPIAVRGRVVKFNAMIMGKNWLHIRDGSGTEGTNDLTVTTAAKAKVGDLVLVTGVLASDRDFGGGYKYGVIVEDATVVVE